MLRIREMTLNDVSFALRLANQEHWGIPSRDFERILRLNPEGSFVAVEGTRRVGVSTTMRYGRQTAWIGNVVVDKRYRGMHIGQRLVEEAITHLRAKLVKHIALYAFMNNLPFYKRLGFVNGPAFLQLRGRSRSIRNETPLVRGQPLTLNEVFRLDRKAFGADRRHLLDAIIRSGDAWFQGRKIGRSASYMLVKKYEGMCEIGPWVSLGLGSKDLDSFLIDVMGRLHNKHVEISCPLSHNTALKLLMSKGFRPINKGRVMCYENAAKIGDPRALLALGFLDKG